MNYRIANHGKKFVVEKKVLFWWYTITEGWSNNPYCAPYKEFGTKQEAILWIFTKHKRRIGDR